VGSKGRLPITGNKIAVGNKAAAKFKHLRSHVKEALLSPGGQHGIFELSGIDISIDVVMPAPPVTGAMLIETPISAARSARRPVIIELSGDVRLQVNLHPRVLVIAVRQSTKKCNGRTGYAAGTCKRVTPCNR
jgi:hypothetical protein